jgi:nucleotide-binding universal stress UspA family protein
MITHRLPSIVVGIDGSEKSAAALRWALREGAARSIPVEVVHCWQLHGLKDLKSRSPHDISLGSVHLLEVQTNAALSGMVAGPEVVRTSIRGRTAPALLHRTEDAALVVIGAHGHLAARHVLRGRIADICIKWAFCPVVVVDADANAISYGESRAEVIAR